RNLPTGVRTGATIAALRMVVSTFGLDQIGSYGKTAADGLRSVIFAFMAGKPCVIRSAADQPSRRETDATGRGWLNSTTSLPRATKIWPFTSLDPGAASATAS